MVEMAISYKVENFLYQHFQSLNELFFFIIGEHSGKGRWTLIHDCSLYRIFL